MRNTLLKLALALTFSCLGSALPTKAAQVTHVLEQDVRLDWFTDSTSSAPAIGASSTAIVLAPNGKVAFAIGGEGSIG
jgi:hypothetical protein